jgi:serine/threonine-protein kinase
MEIAPALISGTTGNRAYWRRSKNNAMKLTELRNQLGRPARGVQTYAARTLRRVACCQEIPEIYDRLEPSDDPQLRLSQIVDGRFLVREIFGRDEVATIYRAVDLLQRKREVALKVPLLSVENDPVSFARFLREEQIGLGLAHPLLQKYFPVAGEKCRPYIAMEFLRGCTLAHLAQEMGPLSEADAFKIVRLLCDALGYMHAQNLVHCDLKPANILLCCDHTLRVMNFGFASRPTHERNGPGQTVSFSRTPQYLAPEQVEHGPIDARTDIYGLGVILHELVTVGAPFQDEGGGSRGPQRTVEQANAPQASNSALSAKAEEIVRRALQCKPEDRYPSMAAFKAELSTPPQTAPGGFDEPLQPQRWPESA